MIGQILQPVMLPLVIFGLVLSLWLIGVLYVDGRRRLLVKEKQELAEQARNSKTRSWLDEALQTHDGDDPVEILESPPGDAGRRNVRIAFFCALVLYTVLWMWTGVSIVALAIAAISYVVVRRIQSLRIARRDREERQAALYAIRLASRTLRAGNTLLGTLRVLALEVQGSVGQSFMEVVRRTELGASVEEAIRDVLLQSKAPELRAFSVSLMVQMRAGADLSVVTDRLARAMDENDRVLRRTRTVLAYGRGAAMVLLAALFFIPISISLSEPVYRNFILHDSTGHLLLAITLGMVAAGLVGIQRYARSDVMQARGVG